MFHIRDEGEQIRWGFNFYPLSSSQIGFLLIGFGRLLEVRYNKRIGRFYWGIERDPLYTLGQLN